MHRGDRAASFSIIIKNRQIPIGSADISFLPTSRFMLRVPIHNHLSVRIDIQDSIVGGNTKVQRSCTFVFEKVQHYVLISVPP